MADIIEHFGSLPDPRIDRKKQHKLIGIIFITMAAVICGCDDWYEIEEYGTLKYEWFKTILELPNGIPSHDTFNRVFSLLNAQALQQCFLSWVQSVAKITEGRIISIDGKRMCNSGEHGSKAIIHMVSAWCSDNNMVLAQQKVNDKSNEITAIPALLEVLSIKDCIVTIDAMGCQKDIAAKIIDKGADYILAVKQNQEHLYDDITEAFAQAKTTEEHTQISAGHGRVEKRTCRIITDTDWVCSKEEWEGLQTLIAIESKRTKKATGATETQVRYFISSKKTSAEKFNVVVREHWSIENKLHWVLDVTFGEDNSTKRAGTAAENFSIISKIAVNLLYQYNDAKGAKKASMKTKRKKAGWDNDYLQAILMNINKI